LLRPPPTPTLFPYTTLFRSLLLTLLRLRLGGLFAFLGSRLLSFDFLALALLPPLLHGLTQARELAEDPLAAGLAEPLLDQVAERSEEHTSELQSRENLVCRL